MPVGAVFYNRNARLYLQVTTLVTAHPSLRVETEEGDLSEDRDLEIATNAEKRDITPVTALPGMEVVLQAPSPSAASSATPATRWDTCLGTVIRDARPMEVVATASSATNLDTWPENAPKVTLDLVLVEEDLVISVVTDPTPSSYLREELDSETRDSLSSPPFSGVSLRFFHEYLKN